MVSELSARLLRGTNYNAPTSTTKMLADCTRSSCVVSPTISDHEPMMTFSACSDKLDKISARSPSKKTLRVESAAPALEGCFKRRKVDELQFAASRVRDDLTKGGLSCPSLDTSLRHHLDLDRHVDATKVVSLVGSKTVSGSPFLTTNASTCCESATMYDFGDLFSATYSCYSKPSDTNFGSNATQVTNSDVSSICSLTSEKSDGSYIVPRLEDALNNKKRVTFEETPEDKEVSAAAARHHQVIYANPISIRDAFENSDEARIITLSFAPFLVVHANPAYTRMTGLSPADVLGKPFHEVIEDQKCKVSTSRASSLTSLHDQVISFHHAKVDVDDNKFRVQVSVVGPEAAEPALESQKCVNTHYMVSLAAQEDSKQEQEEDPVEIEEAITVVVAPVVDDRATTLVVPPLNFLEHSNNVSLMPTMRLHCGVMG